MIYLHTNHGTIAIELDHKRAPETAANFVRYAREGFYEGTLLHRVIRGFMVQGGGLEPDMHAKDTHAPIHNEADNGLSNRTGTVAMARTQDPHSATAQFFINVADNVFLDHTASTPAGWGYCVFGRVMDGMDVVRAIESLATGSRAGHQDVPTEDVVIERVEVEEEPEPETGA
ncbi:peptidyl-prolyl cis-trans isomerase B [bacterium BMS3Bbin12]|nr:peptidyl-prolyl cis-trans isomerase B [bacterium BMS3Abin12]GBE48059.1 peptidyl-prolyl cis-trans isomerase B [bacterium BMS3Bbin12]GBE50106.1 peptidyl-prolyl cis-trans isomerase B [bacterium BMS3Bbin13]HDJ86007.1 peptidyl-prolyl cis-trans isomerase [Chromatiales bacterium]